MDNPNQKRKNFTAYDIERQPQRQDDLNQQLVELTAAAIRLGLYDAADWVGQRMRDCRV